MSEYDFFDDDENEGQNRGERNPAPLELEKNEGKEPKKPKKKVRWQTVVTAVGTAIFVFFFGWLGCWLSLDKQIRTLLDVKKTVQKNYYEEITDGEFYDAVFDGINENLLDKYSGYMSAEKFAEYMQDMQGDRLGVGLVFSVAENASLEILRVCSGSPAESAGILRGERVKAIGDTAEALTPLATYEELDTRLNGYPAGQIFYLQIEGRDGAERTLSIHRAEYTENVLFYQTKEAAYTFVGDTGAREAWGSPLAYLDGDTAYIQLLSFTANADVAFDQAMAQFQTDGKKNLVLDLRGNGGGYLSFVQSIGSYFCKNTNESNPVVAIADYGEKKVAYAAERNVYGEYFAEDSKITVLADEGSASASECLIGCMLDYGAIEYGDICLIKRGTTAKTYGKGIMQETYILNIAEQNALKLTTAKIHWPKGNCIHGVGITEEDGVRVADADADFAVETENAVKKLFE